MPATVNRGGDQLARGAVRVQFRPAGENVTEDKWAAMFDGFDPEAYKKSAAPEVESQGKETNTVGIVR